MKIPIYTAVLVSGAMFGGGYFLGKSTPQEDAEKNVRRDSGRTLDTPRSGSESATPAAATAAPAADGAVNLEPGPARQRMQQALRQSDRLLRLRDLTTVLAAMNEQNANAIEEGMNDCYKAGVFLNDETAMVQERMGQVLKEKSVIVPGEPNGKLNYPPKQRMKGWASADPRAALEWLEKLEPGSVKDGLRPHWLAGLSQADPVALQSMFPGLPPEQQRGLVGGLLNGLQLQGGLPALAAWYDANAKITDPGVLHEAFKGMMWRMGQSAADWDSSAALVKRAAADGLMNRSHFDTLTRNMSVWDPGKCVELFAGLSSVSPSFAESADSVIAGIVERSSGDTLNTLGTWLNAHKDHPLYDRTAAQFAVRTKVDDPAAATHWAESIRDEALRAKTQEALKAN